MKSAAQRKLAWRLVGSVVVAFAASMVGTVDLTSSQPASSSLNIWLTVDSISSVLVLVMDCIRIGFPPPITRSPIFMTFVSSLYISNSEDHFSEIIKYYKYHQQE